MGDRNYGCIGAPRLVKLGASSESHQAKIADLAGSAATMEADLKAATAICAKEHADFEQSEKELLDVIDTLEGRSSSSRRR